MIRQWCQTAQLGSRALVQSMVDNALPVGIEFVAFSVPEHDLPASLDDEVERDSLQASTT